MGFGKRVIGEAAWEAQEAAAKAALARGAGLGSRVTGPASGATAVEEAPSDDEQVTDEATVEKATPPVEAKAKPDEQPHLSLAELAIALEENETDTFFDEMMDAEFARVEGPRKGGLRLLLKSEESQDDPREAVVKELTAALKV